MQPVCRCVDDVARVQLPVNLWSMVTSSNYVDSTPCSECEPIVTTDSGTGVVDALMCIHGLVFVYGYPMSRYVNWQGLFVMETRCL